MSPEEDCSAGPAAEEFGPAESALAEFEAPELAAPQGEQSVAKVAGPFAAPQAAHSVV